HLEPVADDPWVGEQRLDVLRAVPGDGGDVEAVESRAIARAPSEDGVPAQARLGPLQHEELEQRAVVVDRDAPLLVVVAERQVAGGPFASSHRAWAPSE